MIVMIRSLASSSPARAFFANSRASGSCAAVKSQALKRIPDKTQVGVEKMRDCPAIMSTLTIAEASLFTASAKSSGEMAASWKAENREP